MFDSNKRINNGVKRVLKRFPQYKLVDNVDDGDIVLIYSVNDSTFFKLLIINSYNKEECRNPMSEDIRLFYLKHKNQRNKKQLVISDVLNHHFMIQQ